jgi:GTP-binding protein Era
LVVKSKKPVVRVLSKWDAALPGMDKGKGLSCSSVKNYGLLEVVKALLEFLPEGVPYYDEDYYTDQDPYTRISEIIREKAFRNLSQEIPHDLYVSVEEIDEQGDLMRILSYLIVEKDSQKRIVIGKGAEKIQEIATLARVELEQIFGRKVFLSLRVKVDPKWKNNNKIVSHLLS